MGLGGRLGAHLWDEADRLMGLGHVERAKALIMQALDGTDSQEAYAQAVSIFLVGAMYTDAKAVFGLYAERTGRPLKRTDVSLKDIDDFQDRLLNLRRGTGDGEWFKGRYGQGITEIGILPEKLVLTKGATDYVYEWADVIDAKVFFRAKNNDGRYRVRLQTPDQVFQIVLSPTRVINEGRILPDLRRHLDIMDVGE